MGANPAHQPLRQNPLQGGGNQEGLDAHIQQSGYGAGGVVGVQRAEDLVPR